MRPPPQSNANNARLCSNDQVVMYLRNAFDNYVTYVGNDKVEASQETKDKALEIAKALRTNPWFMNGRVPRLAAAGIFYIAMMITTEHGATLEHVATFYNATSGSVGKYYKAIRKECPNETYLKERQTCPEHAFGCGEAHRISIYSGKPVNAKPVKCSKHIYTDIIFHVTTLRYSCHFCDIEARWASSGVTSYNWCAVHKIPHLKPHCAVCERNEKRATSPTSSV